MNSVRTNSSFRNGTVVYFHSHTAFGELYFMFYAIRWDEFDANCTEHWRTYQQSELFECDFESGMYVRSHVQADHNEGLNEGSNNIIRTNRAYS